MIKEIIAKDIQDINSYKKILEDAVKEYENNVNPIEMRHKKILQDFMKILKEKEPSKLFTDCYFVPNGISVLHDADVNYNFAPALYKTFTWDEIESLIDIKQYM